MIHIWRAICSICHTIGEVSTREENRQLARSIFRGLGWSLRPRADGGNLCPRHNEHRERIQERETEQG